MCLIWFWARWKIRAYVWNKLRPGQVFHFLVNASVRVKALVELVLLFALLGVLWISTVYLGSFIEQFSKR
jgi:hypothetical protein